jgi:adenosylhomocysteine nucleosidase
VTVGLLFATRQEAEPFLLQTAAASMAGPLPLYSVPETIHPACIVAVSGMGKVAAALAAAHLVQTHRATLLISAGLCGRLTAEKNWTVGDRLRIESAVEGDCDRFGSPETVVDCDVNWFPDLEAARLVTCDRPVFQDDLRRQLAAAGDVADMEGAAVARTARFYGVSCAMVKGISDCADTTGRQDIARNIAAVSESIAQTLVRELNRHANDERP